MTTEERQALKEEILAELKDREDLKREIMAEYGVGHRRYQALKAARDKWYNQPTHWKSPMMHYFDGEASCSAARVWESTCQLVKLAAGKGRLADLEDTADANALADQILRLVWNYRMAHR